MSLACRHCHKDPADVHPEASYATVLMYQCNENLAKEMAGIENTTKPTAGHCVHCEVCNKYSMISYALACHLHGYHAERNASTYYAKLCASYRRFTECASLAIQEQADNGAGSDLCDELCKECLEEQSDEE
jgi:hypothetical protein